MLFNVLGNTVYIYGNTEINCCCCCCWIKKQFGAQSGIRSFRVYDYKIDPIPGTITVKGIVNWPTKSRPIGSSSQTVNRTRASSGNLITNFIVSSQTGLKPAKQSKQKNT